MWKHFKFNPNLLNLSCHSEIKSNEFDDLLRSEWDSALAQGLFTFQIDQQLKRRIVDGNFHYVIELNPTRYAARRSPYPFESVNTPFDKEKFNFNKIKDEEVLFSLDNEQQTNKHLIIINNAPVRPYHVLLVPYRELEQPQILTADCIRFGLDFVASSAYPFILIGFNSLCAYASINHLHLHAIYMPDRLFSQTIKCSPFHINSNCYLHETFDVQAFAFEIKHIDEFNKIAQHIFTVTNYLTTSNIAHNMSIIKGDAFSSTVPALRVFIWFRRLNIGAKYFDRCNFGCLELAGYMSHRFEEAFNTLTETELLQSMNEIALPLDEQNQIKDDVKKLLDQ